MPAVNPLARGKKDAHVSCKLMHDRLGLRSYRSILAGSEAEVWEGVKIHGSSDDYCVSCKISAQPKASRGHSAVSLAEKPGDVLFMDVIPNPAKCGLTSSTSFKYYLLVVDGYSRYFTYIGMHSKSAAASIQAIIHFAVYHRPVSTYTLHDVKEIHADAGPTSPRKNLSIGAKGMKLPSYLRPLSTKK